MRIEVVMSAVAIALVLMIPGIVIAYTKMDTLWLFIVIMLVNTIVCINLSNILMNKVLTGKFTNHGKLSFDD